MPDLILSSIPSKTCTACGVEFPATPEFFRPAAGGRYGVRSNCRVCEAAYNKAQKKAHYHANAESERAKVAAYRAKNPEKLKAARAKFYLENRERLVVKQAEYNAENRGEITERRRGQYSADIDKSRKLQRDLRAVNPDRIRLRDRAYRQKNIAQVRAKDRANGSRKFKKNYRTNIGFTLRVRLSSLLRASLKASSKSKKMEELLGYTVQDLRAHLESKFNDGMTWVEFLAGKIHIDHVRPVASFDITSDSCSDFVNCWALSNLQPLWAFDNLSKGSKWKQT